MAKSLYYGLEYADRLLRRKDGFGDDPDWAQLGLIPDTILLEVGGVAAAGVYSVQVTPDPAAEISTPALVSFTRVAEANPAIATALAAEFVLEIAATLEGYYTASVVNPAGGTFIALTLDPDAPGHTLVFAAPVGATLASPCDGYFPLAATVSNVRPEDAQGRTELALTFVAVDGGGLPLPDDNACTFVVEVVREVERHSRYEAPNAAKQPSGVAGVLETVPWILHEELRVPFDGGRFTVRLSVIANPPTNATGIEIQYRQVQA